MSTPTIARCYSDPDWKYTRSESTDIRRLFAKIKRQQKEAEAAKKAQNVRPMRKAVK